MGIINTTVESSGDNLLLGFLLAVVFYGVGDYYATRAALDAGWTEKNENVQETLDAGGWDAWRREKILLLGGIGAMNLYALTEGGEIARLSAGLMNLMAAAMGAFATVVNYAGVLGSQQGYVTPS